MYCQSTTCQVLLLLSSDAAWQIIFHDDSSSCFFAGCFRHWGVQQDSNLDALSDRFGMWSVSFTIFQLNSKLCEMFLCNGWSLNENEKLTPLVICLAFNILFLNGLVLNWSLNFQNTMSTYVMNNMCFTFAFKVITMSIYVNVWTESTWKSLVSTKYEYRLIYPCHLTVNK